MLNITYDKNRPKGEGEYFVELTSNRGLDVINCDRLGYWCDKPHLVHMALGILAAFDHYELFAKLLKDAPAEDKEKPENNVQQLKAKIRKVIYNFRCTTEDVNSLLNSLDELSAI